jgi:hypothetical protein
MVKALEVVLLLLHAVLRVLGARLEERRGGRARREEGEGERSCSGRAREAPGAANGARRRTMHVEKSFQKSKQRPLPPFTLNPELIAASMTITNEL